MSNKKETEKLGLSSYSLIIKTNKLMTAPARSAAATAAEITGGGLAADSVRVAAEGGEQRQRARGAVAFTLLAGNGFISLAHRAQRFKLGMTVWAVIFIHGHRLLSSKKLLKSELWSVLIFVGYGLS